MWGKLNQMVSGDQQKIESLESQLEAEQLRNKQINDQFKKLLKEKEVLKLFIVAINKITEYWVLLYFMRIWLTF